MKLMKPAFHIIGERPSRVRTEAFKVSVGYDSNDSAAHTIRLNQLGIDFEISYFL